MWISSLGTSSSSCTSGVVYNTRSAANKNTVCVFSNITAKMTEQTLPEMCRSINVDLYIVHRRKYASNALPLHIHWRWLMSVRLVLSQTSAYTAKLPIPASVSRDVPVYSASFLLGTHSANPLLGVTCNLVSFRCVWFWKEKRKN